MNCSANNPQKYTKQCVVQLLEPDQQLNVEILPDTTGRNIMALICEELELPFEIQIWGLTYYDKNEKQQWLRLGDTVNSHKLVEPIILYFRLKLYPVLPQRIQNVNMCQQIFLQVRYDLLNKRCLVNFEQKAMLIALMIQYNLGDYRPRRSLAYNLNVPVFYKQNQYVIDVARGLHKNKGMRGTTKTQCINLFLRKASQLSSYGTELYKGQNTKGKKVILGINRHGILFFNFKTFRKVAWSAIDYIHNCDALVNIRLCKYSPPIQFVCENRTEAKYVQKRIKEYNIYYSFADNPMEDAEFEELSNKITLQNTNETACVKERAGTRWLMAPMAGLLVSWIAYTLIYIF